MFKQSILRNPIVVSLVIASLCTVLLITAYFLWLDTYSHSYLWAAIGIIASLEAIFLATLWFKKKNNAKAQRLETEEEALAMVIRPLLADAGNKPIYFLVGAKGSGRTQFLYHSSAIKPMDRTRTAKNDFFEWYESDNAIFIKPDQRLTFQEVSSSDGALWARLVDELIRHKPRKPLAGSFLFVDFEFLIVSEQEQKEYAINALLQRLQSISDKTSTAMPLYLFMSKLDKLDGFKEYIQFSSLKTRVEFLTIPLKEAKGAITEYYNDSYQNLVRVLESNALDSSANSTDADEKQAILAFPKQFELCQQEIGNLLERMCEANKGFYALDIREIFFCSSIQGGRKYNLLAKSCSNYFNLPIIASEHTQLSETPYFSRLLVDSQILPERDFAGENKTYLRNIQKRSRLAVAFSVLLLTGGGYYFSSMLESNLSVIGQLMGIDKTKNSALDTNFNTMLASATNQVAPSYVAWINGTQALDEELLPLNISRLDQSTKIAYHALLDDIESKVIPVVEHGYRMQLTQHQNAFNKSLPLLKGYLMLHDPSKRDIQFLRHQTDEVLNALSSQPHVVAETMKYLDAYFRTQFAPVAINMDVVRSTRRSLLSNSNVDLVYAGILSQAKAIDLGTLDIERAVGFDFSNVFSQPSEEQQLIIDKVYTSTGFNTFYRPQVDLMSKQVISDNWVLGLSNHVIPTKKEQEAFKEQVRKKYTDDYINYWRNALSELKVQNYNNVGELTNAIDLISGPSSPLTTY